MPVAFHGDCEWEPTTFDPIWSEDFGYGLDHATLSWRGRRDKKDAFLKSLQRFQTLPGFTGLRLLDARESGGSISFPQIDLEYVGFKNGQVPPAKSVDSIATISAQGSGFDTGSMQQVSGTIICRAPRTVWTWFQTTAPGITPLHGPVNNLFDPRTQIVHYSIQADNGDNVNSIPYSAFVAIFNSLVPQIQISDYEVDPILPMALWQCSATAQVVLN